MTPQAACPASATLARICCPLLYLLTTEQPPQGQGPNPQTRDSVAQSGRHLREARAMELSPDLTSPRLVLLPVCHPDIGHSTKYFDFPPTE